MDAFPWRPRQWHRESPTFLRPMHHKSPLNSLYFSPATSQSNSRRMPLRLREAWFDDGILPRAWGIYQGKRASFPHLPSHAGSDIIGYGSDSQLRTIVAELCIRLRSHGGSRCHVLCSPGEDNRLHQLLNCPSPARGRQKSVGLNGLRVCSFESRKGSEIRSLIERQGGTAMVAPSMREVPLDQNPEAFAFADELFAGRIDFMVFMTGVGARGLLDVLETRYSREAFFEALQKCCVIVRGPKPAAVLREWKVRIDHLVPEPNTWRELLAVLDASAKIDGKRVAVQEYGQPNAEFYRGAGSRGADVRRFPSIAGRSPSTRPRYVRQSKRSLPGKWTC